MLDPVSSDFHISPTVYPFRLHPTIFLDILIVSGARALTRGSYAAKGIDVPNIAGEITPIVPCQTMVTKGSHADAKGRDVGKDHLKAMRRARFWASEEAPNG